MDRTTELALLASHVYGTLTAVQSTENTVPLPENWQVVAIGGAPFRINADSGFMARTYRNSVTNEVVISYAGTTYEKERQLADWLSGNLPGAFGFSLAPQMLDAASYYLAVHKELGDVGISFTGHSLGGGLASLMAVFFDRRATIFDPAPFRRSADSQFIYSELRTALQALPGYALDEAFLTYQPGLLVPGFGVQRDSPSRLLRQRQIDMVSVAGEALSVLDSFVSIIPGFSVLPNDVTRIFGTSRVVDPQAKLSSEWNALTRAFKLHSELLLIALLIEPALEQVSRGNERFLQRLFFTSVNSFPETGTTRNLLPLLVQRQLAGEGALRQLAEDTQRIKRGGLLSVKQVETAVWDIAFAGFYKQGLDRSDGGLSGQPFESFVKEVSGGIAFDLSKTNDADVAEAKAALASHVQSIHYDRGAGLDSPPRNVDDKTVWYLQSGTAPISATSEGNTNDVMLGWDGADTLSGAGGDDLILGDVGDDVLSGGSGKDVLVGGVGADTLFGGDDDDQLYGGIEIDLLDGGAGKDELYAGLGDDTAYGAEDSDLLIGDFGNDTLDGGDGDDEIYGDGRNSVGSGGSDDVLIGGEGGDHLYGGAGADRIDGGDGNDVIYGAAGADIVTAGAGEDEIHTEIDVVTVAGEADTVDGGADKDLIYVGGGNDVSVDGGAGDDLIVGGHGNDILRGGDDKDEIYGGLQDLDDTADKGGDQLYGGAGNDKLYGGNGSDFIFGEDDNDELRGGALNDRLEGGTGFDRYIYEAKDGRDIIKDEGGAGEIEWDKTLLTGGWSKSKTDFVWYDDPDNPRFIYETVDDPNLAVPTTLFIRDGRGGFVEVQNFKNRDLGIDLRRQTQPPSPGQPSPSPKPGGGTPFPPPPPPMGAPIPRRGDPLVLDLDGLGISTLGLGARLHFDHDGDGFAERTGWVGAGDGVLVLDVNEDGRLSGGQELFGDFTRLAGGQVAVNGFAALSAHDRNADGAITAADPIWSSLRVGSFDSDETGRLLLADPSTGLTLTSLDELGIVSLGLGSAILNTTDTQGNIKARTGTFGLADGATQELAEYRFARDPMLSVPVDAPIVSESVAALPRLQGGAKVLRLQEALELDSRPEGYLGRPSGYLRAKLDAFMAETNVSAYYAKFEDLLAAWAGVEGIPPAQLRGEIPARQIAILERFYGQTLAPNPHHWQSFLWQKNYKDLAEALYGDLLAQTHFAARYNAIELVDQGEGRAPFGNLMPLLAGFDAEIAADPAAGQELVNEFGRSLRGRRLTQSTNYFAFREHFLFDAAGNFDEARAFAFDAAGKPVVTLVPGTPGQTRWMSDYTEAVRAVDGGNLGANGGDDVLYGDAASTYITGGAYDNTLYGGGGNDQLPTDAGNDIADGGPGDDFIYGGAGDDVYLFRPGGGHDIVAWDASGFDIVFLGGGLTRTDVTFEPNFRGALAVRILATGETLTLPASQLDFEQFVVAGIERFMFSDGSIFTSAEIFAPSAAPDTLLGTTGSDSIDGLEGDDRIVGYAGNDQLVGGPGDDLILGGSGDDLMEGGAGNDEFDFSEYLQAPGWWYGSGNNHNDSYRFGYGDGADIIRELQGTDTVVFKPGVSAGDVSLTNEGYDLVIRLAGSADRITVKAHFLTSWAGSPYSMERLQFADGTLLGAEALAAATVTGTPGEDDLEAFRNASTRILGLDGDDTLRGERFADRLEGGEGQDLLIGGEGNDQLFGGDGDDRLEDDGSFFNAESNTLDGGAGDDGLTSGFGDDLLRGGEGNDVLFGGHGSDVYIGGAGDDVLTEPNQPWSYTLGADVFVFGRGDGHDRITASDLVYSWWQQYRGPHNEIPTGPVRVDDVLRFGESISPDDITVFAERVLQSSLQQANVRFEIAGDPDSSLTLEGFMGATNGYITYVSSVRRIEFADGTVWDTDDVLDRLVWQGTEARDFIYGAMQRDLILGEGGDDVLYGFNGNDRIFGGAGDDFIDAGYGDDFVEAGEGDDRVLTGTYGSDVIDPGAGDDRIGHWSFEREDELARFAQPGALPGDTTILFAPGYGEDAVFLPNARADSNDTIRLAAELTPGDVKLVRRGDELVLTLPVTGDALTVRGWFRDYINPYSGALVEHPYRVETIEFGDGTRWGAGRMLTEVLIGTEAADRLDGYATDDLLEGRGSADYLIGGAGNDILDGGEGNDYLFDEEGADTIRYGRDEGSDTYQRGYADAASTDTIEFKAGLSPADVIVRRASDGYLFRIADTGEALRVESPFALEARFADGATWSFEDIKARAVLGTQFDDLLIGFDDRADRLEGRGGLDELRGGGGDDTYVYNPGDGFAFIFDAAGDLDTLAFGPGITLDDITLISSFGELVVSHPDGGQVRVLAGLRELSDGTMPNAIERIEFADGTSLSREEILVRVDRVILPGTIFGTENDDLLQGNELDNQIFGLEGDDALYGGEGSDTLEGNSGADLLYGDEGDDSLFGGEGDDELRGGPSYDTLQGGEGSDRYFLEHGGDFDTVLDEAFSGAGTRGDLFPEALQEAQGELADVLALGGEGYYQNDMWWIEADGGWAADLPVELLDRLIEFGQRDDVPVATVEQVLRDLLAWLAEPAAGRRDLYPEAAQRLDSDLSSLQEYSDEDWFYDGGWDNLAAAGELDGIPSELTEPLISASRSEGAYAGQWRDWLRDLQDWLGAAAEANDSLQIDALPSEVEVQATGNSVAIGIAGTNDAILISPLDDDGGGYGGYGGGYGGYGGEVSALAVQRFLFADGTELSLEEIRARADGGVIGVRQDFAGSSFLRGSVAEDTIYARNGDDAVDARANDDFVSGGAGDDIIAGGRGNDQLAGGQGSDVYAFNRDDGDDFVDSGGDGGGNDTLSFGADVQVGDVFAYFDGTGNLHLAVDGGGSMAIPWFDAFDGSELASRELRRLQFVDADGRVTIFDLDAIVSGNLAAIRAASADNPFSLADADLGSADLTGVEAPAGGNAAVAYAQTGDLFGTPFFAENAPSDLDDRLFGGGSDDFIDAGDGSDVVSAGVGDDIVFAGAGNDVLAGGPGSDDLIGEDGDDLLIGGAGNDYLVGGTGADVARGGEDHDAYRYDRGDGLLSIEDVGDNTIEFGGDIVFAELTLAHAGGFLEMRLQSEGDVIRVAGFDATDPFGTTGVSQFYFEAEDLYYDLGQLLGKGFDLRGTDSADSIDGTALVDRITGGAGPDAIRGGPSDDLLDGGLEGDTYFFELGDGRDVLVDRESELGPNVVEFGAGVAPDSLYAELRGSILSLYYGFFGDLIEMPEINLGDPGRPIAFETMRFADGSSLSLIELLSRGILIYGTPGADRLIGASGDDTLYGLESDDFLAGGAGADTYYLYPGSGIDTIDDVSRTGEENALVLDDEFLTAEGLALLYDAAAGTLDIDLVGSGNRVKLAGFDPQDPFGERAIDRVDFYDGTSLTYEELLELGITIEGTAANDVLSGTAARDHIQAGAGDDLVDGTGGGDFAYGGAGDDAYAYSRGDGELTIVDEISAAPENMVLFGPGIALADFRNNLRFVAPAGGAPGQLVIDLGAGDLVRIEGFDPDDAEFGAHGVERFVFADGTSVGYSDLVKNTFIVQGDTGDDALIGTNIADRLYGFEANDELRSGGGIDTLTGGTGDDLLEGGAGGDMYVFNRGDGLDAIREDGNALDENLVVFGPGITRADLTLALDGDVLRIGYGPGDEVRIEDFDPAAPIVRELRFVDGSALAIGAALNDAPQAGPALLDLTVDEDTAFAVQIAADAFSDGNGEALAFAAGLSNGYALPAWLAFDPATGTLSGTPENIDVGSYAITLTATDAYGEIASQPFALNVLNVNDAPAVANAIADQLVAEDVAFVLALPPDLFADVDAGDALTVSVSGLPGWLSFDPASGTLTGTPSNADVGLVHLQVNATDLSGVSLSDDFALAVANVNDTPQLAGPIADQAAIEDALFGFALPAEDFADADLGDTLAYFASQPDGFGLPGWLAFDPDTLTFTGVPTNDDVGTVSLRVTAVDGLGAAASGDLAITVANINDAPVAVLPLANAFTAEDQPFSITVPQDAFLDVDAGDSLTYAANLADGSVLPAWLGFDAASRTLSGTPSNAEVGGTAIRITATDMSGESASSAFTIVVDNVNDAPALAAALPDQTGREGEAFGFTVPAGTFVDADAGDVLALSATLDGGAALPGWLAFDAPNGRFSGTPGSADAGVSAIRVSATDAAGAGASDVFELTVEESGGQGQTLIGTPGDDMLTGTPFADSLDGRGGADRLAAGAGDDLLQFFADARWKGHAHARHAGSPGVRGTGDSEPLAGKNRSHDLFDGGEGFDVLLGTDGHDAVFLEDRLSPPDGHNGPRIAAIEYIATGDGHDLVDLTSERFAYGDVIIAGGEGNDTLWASAGNDLLAGGRGNDRLSGGAGADVYLHELHGGHDVIEEAGVAQQGDVLRFGEGITRGMVHVERRGYDLVLDLDGRHGSVTIKDWFSSGAQRVERIEFADGASWDEAQIRRRAGVDDGDDCRPDHGHGHRDDDDDRHGERKHHDRDEDRHDEHRGRDHDRVADLISARLASSHRFDFESLVGELQRAGGAPDRGEIARRWRAVAAYVSGLGEEPDDDAGRSAPLGWLQPGKSGRSGAGIGWGFEGSVGAARGPDELKTLEGLLEGFRRL